MSTKKVEILAPAGNLEKLKMAFIYGADAVYIGGSDFNLRSFSDNFNYSQMCEGVRFAKKYKGKVYLTFNIFAKNKDMDNMDNSIKEAVSAGVDAFIVSDPGVFEKIKYLAPDKEVHISTQANITNKDTVKFWGKMGASRVVLARELTLDEIKEIKLSVPDMEIECFVHGAMCMSYSGRCFLSLYMTGREANSGNCAQSCRWKYFIREEKRSDEYQLLYNDQGSYILNSKDLCMIQHIEDLVNAGIDSLKIEGRMKSVYYTATVASAYKNALNLFYKGEWDKKRAEYYREEVEKVSHREYFTGFFYGNKGIEAQNTKESSYIRGYDFIALVEKLHENGLYEAEQRNNFKKDDIIEILPPTGEYINSKVVNIYDENMEEIKVAPHPQMKLYVRLDLPDGIFLHPYTILRKKN